jgi:hypothetical protein
MATDLMLSLFGDERQKRGKEEVRHVVVEVERPLVKPTVRNRQGTKQVPDVLTFELEAVSHDWFTFRDEDRDRDTPKPARGLARGA